MKRALFVSLVCPFFFFACKKSESSKPTTDSQEKKAVKFSVANFSATIGDMDTPNGRKAAAPNARVGSEANIAYIYYGAYQVRSGGFKLMSEKNQDTVNNKNDFGTISDSLPLGDYKIILVASEVPVDVVFDSTMQHASVGNHTDWTGNPFLLSRLGDLFYRKFDLTLSPLGSPASRPVVLDRIVGKLEIVALDATPQDSIISSVTINSAPCFYTFLADSTVAYAALRNHWEAKQDGPGRFSTYILGCPSHGGTVVYDYTDRLTRKENVVSIPDVRVYTNKKTVLKGYIFGIPDNVGGPGLRIQPNETWSGDSVLLPIK